MRRIMAIGALAALMAAPAAAQNWSDDFESYSLGEICGKGGWEMWDGGSNVCASVSDEFANSGSKSLRIFGAEGPDGGDDTVHRFDNSGGAWTFKVMTYIPDDAQGAGSIILLNTYPATVNPDWSLVVEFDADFGEIIQWPDEAVGTIVPGRWVEFRAEIDLENDVQDWFYDGKEILSGLSWTEGIACCGELRIQALDLYAGEPTSNGTTGMFFDDVSLSAAGGCEPCDTNCDGSVDLTDVAPFIELMFGGKQCASDCSGDTNEDGSVDLTDVEGFIECLLG